MKHFKNRSLSTALILAALCVQISPSLAADKAATNNQGVKMPWTETGFKKPSDADIKKKLTPQQYDVTQHEGTEAPYQNAYWDNHADGIYVDAVSGEPLFSSKDKFESGTGWPSFSKPLESKNVTTKTDSSLFMERTEVRSRLGQSHLGHVFDDGPKPTGLRYCMNSASMKFIAAADLEKEGYGQYKNLFAAKEALHK